MTTLRWLILLLIVAGASGEAAAQFPGDRGDEADKRERSHRLIDGTNPDAEAALAERLGKVRALRDARKLAEEILKHPERYNLGKDLDRLQKQFKEQGKMPDLNDPALQEAIRKALEQHKQGLSNPSLQLGERQLDGIRGLLPARPEDMMPGRPNESPPAQGPPTPPDGPAPIPPGMPGQPAPGLPGPPQTSGGGGAPSIPNPADPPAPEALGNRAGSKFAEQLTKLGTRLKGLDASLRDSPALNQALRDLSLYRGGEDGDFWEDLAKRFEGVESWLPKRSIELNADRANGLADRMAASLPKMNWRPGSLERWSAPSTPRMSRPNLSGPQEGWFWLLAGVVVVVFAVAYWKMRGWSRPASADGPQGWTLGPWPVDPRRVRTREDLVRAFEYLALLSLGPSARNRHHLDLAQQLGGPDVALRLSARRVSEVALPNRRRAAQELADLYERARYAPPSDPWPEAAVAAARRDLCSLAGVAAA
jgi:hypothetical protein